jgi:hypothetical protein
VLEQAVAKGKATGKQKDKAAVGAELLLAELYGKDSRHKDARRVYADALPDLERLFGANHKSTKAVRLRLGPGRWLRGRR